MSFYSHNETSLAMSTLTIWCCFVQSRDVRSRVFSRPQPSCGGCGRGTRYPYKPIDACGQDE